MNIEIPIYIEERKPKNMPQPLFVVRPLFFGGPVQRGVDLNQTLTALVNSDAQPDP